MLRCVYFSKLFLILSFGMALLSKKKGQKNENTLQITRYQHKNKIVVTDKLLNLISTQLILLNLYIVLHNNFNTIFYMIFLTYYCHYLLYNSCMILENNS